MSYRFAAEVTQILPLAEQSVHQAQCALGGLLRHSRNEFVEHALGHYAEQFAHMRVRDRIAAVSNGLFEKREAVAQAAFGGTGQHRNSASLDRKLFRFG